MNRAIKWVAFFLVVALPMLAFGYSLLKAALTATWALSLVYVILSAADGLSRRFDGEQGGEGDAN